MYGEHGQLPWIDSKPFRIVAMILVSPLALVALALGLVVNLILVGFEEWMK
jgi:hypothetical protein